MITIDYVITFVQIINRESKHQEKYLKRQTYDNNNIPRLRRLIRSVIILSLLQEMHFRHIGPLLKFNSKVRSGSLYHRSFVPTSFVLYIQLPERLL